MRDGFQRACGRRRSRIDSAMVDAWPRARRTQAEPPNRYAWSIVYLACVGLAVLLVWAVIGRLDMVTVMPGEVRPMAQVMEVRAIETAESRDVYVKNGMLVEQDQPIISLDDRELKIAQANVDSQLSFALSEARRVQALIEGARSAPVNNTSRPNTRVSPAIQGRIDAEIKAYREKQKIFELATRRKDLEWRALTEAHAQARDADAAISSHLKSLESLLDRDFLDQSVWLEARLRKLEQQGTLNTLRSRLDTNRVERASIEAEAQVSQLDIVTQWMAELAKLREKIRSLEAQKAVYAHQIEARTLRAPSAGVIEELAVTSPGVPILVGDAIAKIVPSRSKYRVEAWLAPGDRREVYRGQRVSIKIDAFDFTEFGTIDGAITSIGTDSQRHPHLGRVYRVEVSIAPESLTSSETIWLRAGMTARVEARHGTRAVIDYLFAPISRVRHEAAREY